MSTPVIQCNCLSKTFYSKQHLWQKAHAVQAVQNLSFDIMQGEFVAFIGPNGGGKSTTVKMLTSILYPTTGTAQILGLNPWKQHDALCRQIGVVFGQKSQLYYQLCPLDTFHLLSTAYDLRRNDTICRIQHLSELFQVTHLIRKPVRQLSLGERMRCEIIASLLHRPKILFLDEPTIGLDIETKHTLRYFLKHLTQEEGTTVFLTSHDTTDIETMCSRVLLINAGRLTIDTSVEQLRRYYLTEKEICLFLTNGTTEKIKIDTQKQSIESVIRKLAAEKQFTDIRIYEPDLESVIATLYRRIDK